MARPTNALDYARELKRREDNKYETLIANDSKLTEVAKCVEQRRFLAEIVENIELAERVKRGKIYE